MNIQPRKRPSSICYPHPPHVELEVLTWDYDGRVVHERECLLQRADYIGHVRFDNLRGRTSGRESATGTMRWMTQ
jgi:hypothetical protein